MTLSYDLLAQRYKRPVPRYTSYPPVPQWTGAPTADEWSASVASTAQAEGSIALYIHLPFCESLCHFCGCTKVITTNHTLEDTYIKFIFQEWAHTLALLPPHCTITQLHLGGGTPTFFSPQNLQALVGGITQALPLAPGADVSFEAHPAVTSWEHMAVLAKCGFNRVSFGIQDVTSEVLASIGRHQPRETVESCLGWAKDLGYASINVDLIYGLPGQTAQSLKKTLDFVAQHRPHRIAFYSYAHLPQLKPSQRRFGDDGLPSPAQKLYLESLGRKGFQDLGYVDLGFDHFALPGDSLALAHGKKTLHRNFMGYTVHKSPLLIGLGMSAISQTPEWYAQNPKDLASYTKACQSPFSSFFSGCRIDPTDTWCQKRILDLSCQLTTTFSHSSCPLPLPLLKSSLQELEEDGLVHVHQGSGHLEVSITAQGVPFLRHVCQIFDLRAKERGAGGFSSGV